MYFIKLLRENINEVSIGRNKSNKTDLNLFRRYEK